MAGGSFGIMRVMREDVVDLVSIDREKCVACGACIRDCAVHVLTAGADGYPVVRAGDERFCIGCQHCLAVCARGAVTCNGVGFSDTLKVEPVPDGAAEAALVRQRRSVRQWGSGPIPDDVWKRLVDALAWMPTGCNDHRLHFTLVRDAERMEWFRSEMSRAAKLAVRTGIPWLLYPKFRRFMSEALRGDDVVFRNAPCMIVASTPRNAPCREADPWIALSYFDLLAQANGLGTCWSGFAVHAFKLMRKFRRALKIPKDHSVGAVLLFGPPGVEYARVPHPPPMPVDVL